MLNPLDLADHFERILKRRESELAEWRELIAYLRRNNSPTERHVLRSEEHTSELQSQVYIARMPSSA